MDLDEHVSSGSNYVNMKDNLSKNKKKKCRGNRKLQRFRRQCRKKGMTNQAIETLISINNTNTVVQEDTQRINNEKMDVSCLVNTTSNTINMPILSENQNRANECQDSEEILKVDSTNESLIFSRPTAMKEGSSVPTTTYRKRTKTYNLSNDHWKQVSKLIPNYKKLSPYQFKDVLTKMTPANLHHHMKKWLKNFEMLQFVQHHAQLICTVVQLKIEQCYWDYIADLITMPVVIWLSEAGKHVTQQNFINWDHTKTKINIQYRQKLIRNKLQQTEHDLRVHFQQSYPFNWEMQNTISVGHFMCIIVDAIFSLVENSLYYFRINFEQKTILLNFDIKDAQLIKSFYDLNPTEEQISSAQNIWRAEFKSCKRALRRNKKNHSSSMMHPISTQETDYGQQNELLSMQPFTSPMSTIVEARLTNMEQRAQQLTKFIHTIDDNVFL